MANRARGEVDAEIGGKRVTLVLGLGALAELEDAFGVDSFEDALGKISGDKVRARDLRTFMLALLRGNEVDDPAITGAVNRMSPAEFMDILLPLFQRSGLIAGQATEAKPEGGDGPLAGRNGGSSGSGSGSATSGSRRPRSGR